MFLQLDAKGSVIGYSSVPQDMTQGLFIGGSQIQVLDNDPRIATFQQSQVLVAKPTPLQWFMRLSQATQIAMKIAARTDVAVDLAMMYASGVPAVDVTDPLTIQNVQMLQSKLLLTAAEAATLLAP